MVFYSAVMILSHCSGTVLTGGNESYQRKPHQANNTYIEAVISGTEGN